MDSYRLIINNNDLSTSSIEQTTSVCGYTVIKAPKGPKTPIRIPANSAAKIKDIFGEASTEYPEIYEATTFNTNYDLYISAPYTSCEMPYGVITKDGVFLAQGKLKYNDSLEKAINEDDIGELELSNLVESGNISILKDLRYPKATLGQKPNISTQIGFDTTSEAKDGAQGITYNLGLTLKQLIGADDSKSFGDSSSPLIVIRGIGNEDVELQIVKETVTGINSAVWYIKDTSAGKHQVGYLAKAGALGSELSADADASDSKFKEAETEVVIVLTGSSTEGAPLKESTIITYAQPDNLKKLSAYIKSEVEPDKVYGIITSKYPTSSALHITFGAFDENRGFSSKTPAARNTLKITAYEDGAFHNVCHPVTFTGSLDRQATDANGSYIGFTSANSSYAAQDLVFVYSFNAFKEASELSNVGLTQYAPLTLEGGVKSVVGDKGGKDIYTYGWEEAKNEDYSVVDVFFDAQRHNNTDPCETFRGLAKYHPLSGFIFNRTIEPNDNITTTLSNATPLDYGENYWNICNEAIVDLGSYGGRIISPITGARAAMQCRIIENRYGGVAPMYLNSGTPSMGGQLTVPGICKMRFKYSKDIQRSIDELNYNTAVMDHTYGVMVVNQRTCKSGATTDWSYIGHVCSFINFQREVRTQVMIPQLGKPNNPYYRELRREQVLKLLEKRLEGNNRIWAEASVDTSTAAGCNDVQAQKAKKFIINVKVKPDIYSEFVELNFTNVDPDMAV